MTTTSARLAAAGRAARAGLVLLERRERPDDIVEEFAPEAMRQADAMGRDLVRLIFNMLDARLSGGELLEVLSQTQPDGAGIAELAFELNLRAAMLGADDSEDEGEGERIPIARFSRHLAAPPIPAEFLTSGKLRPKPFDDAIEAFRSRAPVTRDVFDQMDARARADSFTMARLTTDRAVGIAQGEVRRSLEDANWSAGAPLSDLKTFRRNLVRRLAEGGILVSTTWVPKAGVSGGLSPSALSPNHIETVFRNGTMGAYADGRRHHMQQPHVAAARPWWQVQTVNDGPPRQRKTHQAVHGWVMRADDPGWLQTASPFGHNCRCRMVARSQKWVDAAGPHMHSGPLPNLPDPGWTTRNPPPMIQTPLPGDPAAVPPSKAEKQGKPPGQAAPAQPKDAGPSLIKAADKNLQAGARRALAELDQIPRVRGTVSPSSMGYTAPNEARRAAFVEVQATLDLDAIAADPLSRFRGRGLGGSRVSGTTVFQGEVVVHLEEVKASRVANVIRKGSGADDPLLVEWPNPATGELELHLYGTKESVEAFMADGLRHGRPHGRVIRHATADINILQEATPLVDSFAEAELLRDYSKQGARQWGKRRGDIRRVIARDGLVSRDLNTARTRAHGMSVRKSVGRGAGASHDSVSGSVNLARSSEEATREIWGQLGTSDVLENTGIEALTGRAAEIVGPSFRINKAIESSRAGSLIHEEIHGCSSLNPLVRKGSAMAFEEASTELLSRRTMRRLIGVEAKTVDEIVLTFPEGGGVYRGSLNGKTTLHPLGRPTTKADVDVGPYDRLIRPLLGTSNRHGFSPDDVEKASAAMRSKKYRGKWLQSAEEQLEVFADELPWKRMSKAKLAAAKRKLVKELDKDLRKAAVGQWGRKALARGAPVSPFALDRNDLEAAIQSYRSARAAGVLTEDWLRALLRLQDDPRALEDQMEEDLEAFVAPPFRAA